MFYSYAFLSRVILIHFIGLVQISSYTDTITSTGEFQCLIHLTTQPALCAHGKGATVNESLSSAAEHAIRMLKVFSA